jgi:hypothetical protein
MLSQSNCQTARFPNKMTVRRDGRVVDGGGLENRSARSSESSNFRLLRTSRHIAPSHRRASCGVLSVPFGPDRYTQSYTWGHLRFRGRYPSARAIDASMKPQPSVHWSDFPCSSSSSFEMSVTMLSAVRGNASNRDGFVFHDRTANSGEIARRSHPKDHEWSRSRKEWVLGLDV